MLTKNRSLSSRTGFGTQKYIILKSLLKYNEKIYFYESTYEYIFKLALTSFRPAFNHRFQGEVVCSISTHRRHYAMFRAAPHRL